MKNTQLIFSRLLAVGLSCATVLGFGLLLESQPSYSQTPDNSSANPEESSQPQADISEQELQKFAQAYQQVQQIQQTSETQMVQAVEQEGLSPERFIEISESQQTPETDNQTAEVSTEEQQGFDNAKSKIIEIRQKTEVNMAQAIEAQGLEIPRFNEILTALQQDENLREQFQQIMVN